MLRSYFSLKITIGVYFVHFSHLKPWNLADSKAFSLHSSAEKIAYYLRAFELARVVDMAVNVRRRTHVRVSKPVLNHLHQYFVGKEQGRAGMSQIVEANFLQSVFGKNDFEMRTDILRRKNIPDGVHADVVEIFFIICTPQ